MVAASKNAGRYEEYANIIAKTLSPVCDASKVTLFVEPGGAVVCTPGYYLGRVVDAKDVRGRRFVVTELSRLNIDHEMKKTAYAHVLYTSKTNSIDSQILCGFTCMESDRLCELTDEAELLEGDLGPHQICRCLLDELYSRVFYRACSSGLFV